MDVLTLSATPIPRTLHMSLSGLRDISIIETPPEGRRPIRTTVAEYDEELKSSDQPEPPVANTDIVRLRGSGRETASS